MDIIYVVRVWANSEKPLMDRFQSGNPQGDILVFIEGEISIGAVSLQVGLDNNQAKSPKMKGFGHG
ncbi:hypothetical protein [Shewanella algidipiscicola]|nr:hypothetical protein [Shewanella algidipiscicola]